MVSCIHSRASRRARDSRVYRERRRIGRSPATQYAENDVLRPRSIGVEWNGVASWSDRHAHLAALCVERAEAVVYIHSRFLLVVTLKIGEQSSEGVKREEE